MPKLNIILAASIAVALSGCAISQADLAAEQKNRIEFDTTKGLQSTYNRLMTMANYCWRIEYAPKRFAVMEGSFEPGSNRAVISDAWARTFDTTYAANIAMTGTDHGTHVVVTYMYSRIGSDSKETAEGVQKWINGNDDCYGGF